MCHRLVTQPPGSTLRTGEDLRITPVAGRDPRDLLCWRPVIMSVLPRARAIGTLLPGSSRDSFVALPEASSRDSFVLRRCRRSVRRGAWPTSRLRGKWRRRLARPLRAAPGSECWGHAPRMSRGASRRTLMFVGGMGCGASCCVEERAPGRSMPGAGIRGHRRRRTGSPSHLDGAADDAVGTGAHHSCSWWVRRVTSGWRGARRTRSRAGRSPGRCIRDPAG